MLEVVHNVRRGEADAYIMLDLSIFLGQFSHNHNHSISTIVSITHRSCLSVRIYHGSKLFKAWTRSKQNKNRPCTQGHGQEAGGQVTTFASCRGATSVISPRRYQRSYPSLYPTHTVQAISRHAQRDRKDSRRGLPEHRHISVASQRPLAELHLPLSFPYIRCVCSRTDGGITLSIAFRASLGCY